MPRFQFNEIIKRLNKIFRKVKPRTIVVNGDLKHEFGTISEQEWRNVLKLIDYLSEKCDELILVKGNHDINLGPIARKRKIEIKEYYQAGNAAILHGHKIIPGLKSKILIIGHEHPAISLRKGQRAETYKCYLAGKYKKSILIVQPSINLINEGTDIMKEKLLSPFLKQNLCEFSVFVVEDRIYDFGKLKNLKI